MKQLKYIMSATFFALNFTNATDMATSSNNSSMQDKEIRLAEFEATGTLQEAIELLVNYHPENHQACQNGYGHPFRDFLCSPAHYQLYIPHLHSLSQQLTSAKINEIIVTALHSIHILPTLADTTFADGSNPQKDENRINADEFIKQIRDPRYSPQVQNFHPRNDYSFLRDRENKYAASLLEKRQKEQFRQMRYQEIEIAKQNCFSSIDNQIESHSNGKITFCSMISEIENIIRKLVTLGKDDIFDGILLQTYQKDLISIFDTILLQASQQENSLQDVQALERLFRALQHHDVHIIQPYTTNIGKWAHQIIILYWQINSIPHSERLKAAHPLIIENAKDPLVNHFLLMVFRDTVISNAETENPLADSNL
ncbi:MAG: hypothetical protein KF798_05605 [Candidatus Paracaedibacteraceae bacterium]|nr:hypothetical protein [Candidatus Paracaedibacteraceae bacterium]